MSKKFLLTAMLGLCIGIVGMGLSACGGEEENSSKPPVQGTTPSVNGGLNGGGMNNGGGNMNNGCAHSLKEEVTKAATCEETDYLKGTTDTTASLDVGDKEHFTLNTEMSTLSGNIEGNGSLVLQVYYDRKEYTVTFEKQGTNSMYAAAVGTHKYGTEISTAVDNVQAGFEAVWYAGETPFIMNEETYLIDRDFDIRIETRAEMANFEFELSGGECKITGVKDKTVKEIIVPDYVTRIEYGAFNGCSNVVSMELPFVGRYEDAEDMQVLFGYIFGSEYYEGAQNTSQHYYESSTTTSSRGFYIPNSLTSVKVRGGEISAFAFEGCTYLQEVTLGEGVTKIRESAFDSCRGLKKIVISDSVLTIEKSAFSGCKKLESVTIGDGVTSIGEKAFYGCHALMDLIIGDSVTSIGKSAFSNCYALMRVTIGEKVRSIGDYAFESSRKLVEIYNKSSLSLTIGGSDYGYVARDAKNIYTPTEGASKLSTDEEGYVLYEDGADTVVIGYVGTETALTLPVGVTEINQYAFYLAEECTSVEIPDSVILVGDRAFQNCTKMTDVMIGDGVTDIGEQAFYNCTNLSNITIGESVTYISSNAFNETAYYKDENNWDNGVLYIGDCLYTSNNTLTGEYTVKEGTRCIINGAFLRNTGLTGISIPDSVTYIGENAFNGCNSLMSVYITNVEDWMRISFAEYDANPLRHGGNLYVDGELLTELNVNCDVGDYAFYQYKGLTSVTLGEGVTSIGDYAFYACSGLTEITILGEEMHVGDNAFLSCLIVKATIPLSAVSIFPASKVEELVITSGDITGSMFSRYDALQTLTLSDGVTGIGEKAFSGLDVKSVIIGNGVTSIGASAFQSCAYLTEIVIPNSVKSIGASAFQSCAYLTEIVIPNSVKSIGKRAFYYCTALTRVELSNSVESIGDEAFSYCKVLTEIVIPDSVKSLGERVFRYSSELQRVTIGSGIESCGVAVFRDCDKLSDVTIKNGAAYIGQEMFAYCDGLEKIVIPGSVKTIEEDAFYKCLALQDVTLEDGVGNLVRETFAYCTALTEIVVPGSATIGDLAFYECTALQSVTLEYGIESIGDNIFIKCSNLKELVVPDSVTTVAEGAFVGSGIEKVTAPGAALSGLYGLGGTLKELTITCGVIGEGALSNGFRSLQKVVINDDVTSIEAKAFSGCSALSYLTIGKGVSSIGDEAFYGCSSLMKIKFMDTKAAWNAIPKGTNWCKDLAARAYVNCEDGNIML